MPPKGAPAKGKGKPRSAEDEALNKANAVDDIMDDEYKKNLRQECRKLEDLIKNEDKLAYMYNDERIRISYFWMVGKKELEDKDAELRNKNRELQDLKEKQQIEIKIYMQRLMHLMFQNTDQLTNLKKEAQVTLKNAEDEHRVQERELKQDLRSERVKKKEQEQRQKEYENALHRSYNKKMTMIRSDHERICNEIQLKYKARMGTLRQKMEKKRKDKIKEIEDAKNKTIKTCTERHEKKYQDIKDYYFEITSTNLDIIKFLKEDLSVSKNEEAISLKMHHKHQKQNKDVTEPLWRAKNEKKELKVRQHLHLKIKGDLDLCQEDIRQIESSFKESNWEYEVKLQQFDYMQAERKQLFDEFHKLVYEMHQKTGLRNLILEKKLETIQESLDAKEASINQILTAANIDPEHMGMVRSTLDEVENIKNEAIKSIQTELKKIREAHSNMVKTYEGKLSEFGIPVEELGFDPLVPANI